MEDELVGEGGRETRGRADEMVQGRDEGRMERRGPVRGRSKKGLGN